MRQEVRSAGTPGEDPGWEEINGKAFRVMLLVALAIMLCIVVRAVLLGGPLPWADAANAGVLGAVFAAVRRRPAWRRPLAWLVLAAFFGNALDGLLPAGPDPVTPTHLLLPLLVLYGVLLGDLALSLTAAGIVCAVYAVTALHYWPLAERELLQLTNLVLGALGAGVTCLAVWLYHRDLIGLLRRQRDALERELAENRRLNAVISHDIANPLGAIVAVSDLALLRGGMGADEVGRISRMAARIAAIIDSVRVLRPGSAGALAVAPVSVSGLAAELAEVFAGTLEARGQSLVLAEGGELQVVTCAAVLSSSVLGNLVSNASKVSPAGAAIELGACAEDGGVRIEVRDRGPGFPAAGTPAGGAGEPSGQGYGLPIANMYLKQLGGSVEFTARAGGGTTAAVRLPHRGFNGAAPAGPGNSGKRASPGAP